MNKKAAVKVRSFNVVLMEIAKPQKEMLDDLARLGGKKKEVDEIVSM